MAHLLGAEAPAGVTAIAEARARIVERLAKLLASGRDLRPRSARELPAETERHLVAGAFAILSERVGEAERLPLLAPELTSMLATPYVTPHQA
jgi:hypothetical protein